MIFRDFSWFFDLYRGGGVSEHPSRNGLERGREMAEEEWLREREWKRGRTEKKVEPRPPPSLNHRAITGTPFREPKKTGPP